MKLIGMIILGVLSALLSYYNKNYYVRIFDDILGKEEEEDATAKVGRGFIYGFFFPIYFFLALVGIVALIAFLIVAGIVAGIAFALVWVTEKIIPHSWFGNIMRALFSKIGLSEPAPLEEEARPGAPAPTAPAPEPAGLKDSVEADKKEASSPDSGINVTRRHSLD